MSGKAEGVESLESRVSQQSVSGSISEDSLSSPQDTASPQSFAALKQAYDFMLPQYKLYQTTNRNLAKENEELKRKLTEKEEFLLEMSEHYPDFDPNSELLRRGRSSSKQTAAVSPEELSEESKRNNGDNFRASPGFGGIDSAINLNDDSSLVVEKSVKEERGKWVQFCHQLLANLPEDKLNSLKDVPEHCCRSLEEYSQSTEKLSGDQDSIISKLNTIKKAKDLNTEHEPLRTSQLVTPANLVQSSSGLKGSPLRDRNSPVNRYVGEVSDDDLSDEDIYSSGIPNKRGGAINVGDEDKGSEWVRVDNVLDILSRYAEFVQNSLELNMELMKKNEENRLKEGQPLQRRSVPKETERNHQEILQQRPRPIKPMRYNIPFNVPENGPSLSKIHQERLSHRPTNSDPGRALPYLNDVPSYYSDPSSSRRWNPQHSGRARPLSEADISAPLHELPVKYPPSLEGVGSTFQVSQAQNFPLGLQYGYGQEHYSPSITMDHNFRFEDGQTFQPRGPPESGYPGYKQEEEEDLISWNAARNPEMFEEMLPQPPLPPRQISRSDPVKQSPRHGEVSNRLLPKSSDRIFDTNRSKYSNLGGTDPLPKGNYSTLDEKNFQPYDTDIMKEATVCPVCSKSFEPSTPEVVVQSHVNLHFEEESQQFEVIEK